MTTDEKIVSLQLQLENERDHHKYWHRVSCVLFTTLGGLISALVMAVIMIQRLT